MKRNEVVIDGRLLKRGALRHTPAGVPAINVTIGHDSVQTEAGIECRARCAIEVTAVGEIALRFGAHKVDRQLQVSGFLARRSVSDNRLVLHALGVKSVAGDDTE